MDIIKDKALMLTVRDADKITQSIEKSRVVGKVGEHTQVLVNWGIQEVQRLANLGIKRPVSPIMRDYNWPGMYSPMDHQKETAAFLSAHRRSFCFNEQGCGKTASVIWAADYLMTVGLVKKVLVVSPLSIMHSAWIQDLFTVAMHRTAAVAHGTRQKRLSVIRGEFDFTIINYDGITTVKDELAAQQYDLVVCDECTYVKNSKTTRWKSLNSVIPPRAMVWMLTGTPAAQSPEDAYGIAKMLNPKLVPQYAGTWRDMVMTKVSQFRWVPKSNAKDTVSRALRPAIRFTKSQCLDLPPVTYQLREIEMTRQQKRYYEQLKKKLIIEAAGEQVTAANAAIVINKLLQLSAGCVYADNGETIEFDASSRLKEVVDAVEAASHKTIVFVPFRHAIEVVAERLRKEGFSVGIINGGVSLKARTQIFKSFQESPDPHVLVVQPQSASHGVTLTAANTIVWYGPVASVETWLQANERINRPSQLNKMTVIKISGSPVEKRLYNVLESRETSQKALVSLYETFISE